MASRHMQGLSFARRARRTFLPSPSSALSVGRYTSDVVEAAFATGTWGTDPQLVADQTYFAVEQTSTGQLVACGGWSFRAKPFGAGVATEGASPRLDPKVSAAKIRAFFVHPAFANRGLAGAILAECVDAASAAGFTAVELTSTMPGEAFYRSRGFEPAATDGGYLMVPLGTTGLAMRLLPMRQTVQRLRLRRSKL